MKVYILFEVDDHCTRQSRVCLGVYSSEEKAREAADAGGMIQDETLIIETELDDFEEL